MKRIEYKAQFYPSRDVLIKHSVDLEFMKMLHFKFTAYKVTAFIKKLEDPIFRNDLTHFIQVIIWISDTLTLKQVKFLNSDYGALHLLTHMQWDERTRANYGESLQEQIRDLCIVPDTWEPETFKL